MDDNAPSGCGITPVPVPKQWDVRVRLPIAGTTKYELAAPLFDRDGASIIVHARADDYATQPDGNAGPRLACGTIIRTVAPGTRKGASHRAHK